MSNRVEQFSHSLIGRSAVVSTLGKRQFGEIVGVNWSTTSPPGDEKLSGLSGVNLLLRHEDGSATFYKMEEVRLLGWSMTEETIGEEWRKPVYVPSQRGHIPPFGSLETAKDLARRLSDTPMVSRVVESSAGEIRKFLDTDALRGRCRLVIPPFLDDDEPVKIIETSSVGLRLPACRGVGLDPLDKNQNPSAPTANDLYGEN